MDDEEGSATRTFGVEEEFHVVDLASREVVPDAPLIIERLPEGVAKLELHAATVETATAVCTNLEDLRRELAGRRRQLAAAAQEAGLGLAAAGSLPLVDWSRQRVPDDPRYQRLLRDYRQQAREQVICGCHVHVGIEGDHDLAVRVLSRVTPHLPILLALSTSSPYWSGCDTGYASWRAQMWRRWPLGGLPPHLESWREYDETVERLQRFGVLPDLGMLYWELRPSRSYPTLEFRIADACARLEEVLLQAALSRALVTTAVEEERRGDALPRTDRSVLDVARFLAARDGLGGDLLDPVDGEPVPARDAVNRLVAHVASALDRTGDRAQVDDALAGVWRDGTGADRQRRAEVGGLPAVVDLVVSETLQ